MSKSGKASEKKSKTPSKKGSKKKRASESKKIDKESKEDKKSEKKSQECPSIDKIKKSLSLEGYPLELETYRKFWDDGWAVGLQWPFKDPDTSEFRYIDITASKTRKLTSKVHPKLKFSFDIECKKQRNAVWVFHEWNKMNIDWKKISYSLLYCQYSRIFADENPNKEICEYIGKSSHQAPDLHATQAILGMSIPLQKDSGQRGSAKDLLYDACQKVSKCVEYNHQSSIKSVKKRLEYSFEPVPTLFWRRYPVIIFDGCMYKIQVVKDDFILKETPYVQYQFRAGGSSYLIDVIQKNYLPEFLKKANDEIDFLEGILNEVIWEK